MQGLPYHGDAPQIADEDEEEHEGQQQAVVQFFQNTMLEQQEPEQNDCQYPEIRHQAEYRQQAQPKEEGKSAEACLFPCVIGHMPSGFRRGKGCLFLVQAEEHQQYKGKQRQMQGGAEKLSQAHAGNGIKIQILGVAHGGQHAAQIGGDGLHDDNGNHTVCQVRPLEEHDGEGHKGDKGHIIGHQHGREEAEHDKGRCQLPQVFRLGEQLRRKTVEHAHLLQPAHDCHQAEQQR